MPAHSSELLEVVENGSRTTAGIFLIAAVVEEQGELFPPGTPLGPQSELPLD